MILNGDAKVAAAFVAARREIGATVGKDRKGNYGSYATLAALTEATTEPLAKQGCAIVQEASFGEEGVLVETWLIHESGGTLQFSPLLMPVKDRTAQAVGSAITYARRYALAAICGIAPEDDDGDAATHGRPQAKPQPQPQRPQQPPAPPPASRGERLAETTHKRLHALGTEAYGDQWDDVRHRAVARVSNGAITSSNDLTEEEARTLIAGIEKKLADATEQKFDAPTPAERGARPTGSQAMRARMQGQAA